ncbi:L-serine ammonia-lyase [Cupriavidus pauculus]|uniref:L-serine dehydratase n=1 Tax=Cupriavidus pauculus TaxID=82633 RepID=A0A2N5C8J6_9BURK|nr:L-serine ammonia-lyase [Cupriavidus pauculus]PLP98519.1 L-serine ammonia-lyase [Cupriavidus pauculus]
MYLSTFDLFKIGIGPSSSHTVGPMLAALTFARALGERGTLSLTHRIQVDLHGSLGATGRGHATDRGVMLGLMGEQPDTVDPDFIEEQLEMMRRHGTIALMGSHGVAFNVAEDIRYLPAPLPDHPNALTLSAFDATGVSLSTQTYYSVGGGFITTDVTAAPVTDRAAPPYPFDSGASLLAQCHQSGLSIAELVLANEMAWADAESVRSRLLQIWKAMADCVLRGSMNNAPLSSGLRRRAPDLLRRLQADAAKSDDFLTSMDWVNLFAMAVNEENAAGGRVVTAPTNGAAGIVPAVLHYYVDFVPGAHEDGICDFLLTAAAIGMLYKLNASISGAEVGCQGEVGVACSMAAAALAAVLGGTPEQVEHAAEIGMEHNLGLTCDPVGGLVQIPCIERNAIASVKAINAARMAVRSDGGHKVSLDAVIRTMRATGADMAAKYKETSLGGLAVNVVLC